MVGSPLARTPSPQSTVLPEAPPETSRIRIAVHDLALARAAGSTRALQQAEDVLSSLLFPRLLAATSTVAAGRLDNTELIRLTSALLTSSMRAGNPEAPTHFVEMVIDRSLARLADHLCRQQTGSLPATVLPAPRPARPRVG